MRTFNNVKEILPYRFVGFDNTADSEALENITSSKGNIIGISDSVKSLANDIADIYMAGEVAQIEAGGAFSAGDELTSDSSGRAIKASAGDNIGAIALQNASAQGDIISVIVSLGRSLQSETVEETTGGGA